MSKIHFDKRIDLSLVFPIAAGLLLVVTLGLTVKTLVTLFMPPKMPDTALSPQQQVLDQALTLLESLN
jgi:hypothetical protein